MFEYIIAAGTDISDADRKCPISPAPYIGNSIVVYTTMTEPAIVDIPTVIMINSSCLVIEER